MALVWSAFVLEHWFRKVKSFETFFVKFNVTFGKCERYNTLQVSTSVMRDLDHNVKTESSGFGYQGWDLESRLDPKTALGTLTKNSLGGKNLVGTKMTNLGIHWNDLI